MGIVRAVCWPRLLGSPEQPVPTASGVTRGPWLTGRGPADVRSGPTETDSPAKSQCQERIASWRSQRRGVCRPAPMDRPTERPEKRVEAKEYWSNQWDLIWTL